MSGSRSTRLKYLLDDNRGGVWGNEPDGLHDSIVLRSTEQTADGRWRIALPAVRSLTATERRTFMLQAGDVIVTKSSGSESHIGKATLVDGEVAALRACYSNFMQRLRPGRNLEPRYLWYLLQSDWVRQQFALESTTTTGLSNLTGGQLGRVEVPDHPRPEQRAIADYLDRETGQIDAFIAKNEELIRLLHERRSAAISHAVTSGRTAALPTGWRVERFSRVAKVRGGLLPPSDVRFEELALIAPNHVEPRTGKLLQIVPATEQPAESGKYLVRRGDVIYSKIRPALAKAVIAPEACLCSADMYAITARSSDVLDNRYLKWQLLSKQFTEWATERSMRVAMPKLNQPTLNAAPLVLPPIDEQRDIADYLDAETAHIDGAIATAQRAIELARERRAALISAAVTGKIDVGEAA